MCLAVPGRILRLFESDDTVMSDVDFGGVVKQVCLQYIPDAAVGDYVIVHVGFALQKLDEESALATLANFERLGIMEEEFGDGFAIAARQAGVPLPVGEHQAAASPMNPAIRVNHGPIQRVRAGGSRE
jgi:hydrogenase expression/formation protein HypC